MTVNNCMGALGKPTTGENYEFIFVRSNVEKMRGQNII